MRKRRLPKLASALAVTSAASLFAFLPITSAFAQYSATVVMSGLDNPRGLAFGPDGSLYVTEAGRGGTGTIITGGTGDVRYGATGAVSRLSGGSQSRVLINAPSLAGVDASGNGNGSEATGLQDIIFVGNQAYGIIGLGANPAETAKFTASDIGSQFLGKLVSLTFAGNGTITTIADVSAFETANNPGAGTFGDTVDSNPFSLIALPGGQFAVTDAGGNSVIRVIPGAVPSLSLLSYIGPSQNNTGIGPPFYQGVPTGITLGPDGSYYFTQLTGFPFPVGGANIFKYNPLTNQTTVAYSGFTNLLDLAFAPDGSLYALQNTTNGITGNPPLSGNPGPGVLIKIATDGTRTIINNQTLSLSSPTALAIGQDGAIYVSNRGNEAGTGQVVRFAAIAPEPGSLPLVAAGGLLSLVGLVKRRQRRAVK